MSGRSGQDLYLHAKTRIPGGTQLLSKRPVMEAAQNTFISSTYWTERIGPAAALATIRKHRACRVPQHLARIGELVRGGWCAAAGRAGLPITIAGFPAMTSFAIHHDQAQAAATLFTQLMLERGFLATKAFNPTYAHDDRIVEEYLQAVEEVFGTIARALERGDVTALLRGPVAHTGFARLN